MISSSNITAKNPYLEHSNQTNIQNNQQQNKGKEEVDVMAEIEKSAVKVSLSMNAQIILFAMDSSQLSKDTMAAQKDIFNLLSGKDMKDGFNLKDLGYEGKPITELSKEEATELVGENGFFGVEQTAQRVAGFVFSFANGDPEIIKKGLEGIKKGFEEAEKMWGGELPEISHKTQTRTIELINNKIAELEAPAKEETKTKE